MKKVFLFISLLLCCSLVLSSCNPSSGKPGGDGDEEGGGSTVQTLVAGEGEGHFSILYPEADAVIKSAAEMLALRIEEATGVSLPVCTEGSELETEGRILLSVSESAGSACTSYEGNEMRITAKDATELYAFVSSLSVLWTTPHSQSGIAPEGDSLVISEEICGYLNSNASSDATLRILTQNLRCADDGNGNNVDERAPRFFELVAEYAPDLIGTQETTAKWNSLLKENLGETYAMLGVSRNENESNGGEWNTVLYRRDRFELLDSGTFWLSDTPDVPSRIEESSLHRICTFAVLRDLVTGQVVYYFNTHLDHIKEEARTRQSEILIDWILDYCAQSEYGEEGRFYLTGDFNTTAETDAYWNLTNILGDDARMYAMANESDVDYTYHAYGKVQTHIDFCFFDSNSTHCLTYRILDDTYGGYVSDHYGVLSVFYNK